MLPNSSSVSSNPSPAVLPRRPVSTLFSPTSLSPKPALLPAAAAAPKPAAPRLIILPLRLCRHDPSTPSSSHDVRCPMTCVIEKAHAAVGAAEVEAEAEEAMRKAV